MYKPISLLCLCFAFFGCTSTKRVNNTLVGKLVVKAPCGHYVVSLIGGRLPASSFEEEWTDSTTEKEYRRVFAVANSCSFPVNDLNEGDEFIFTLGGKPQNCMVCMIFYPTPDKKLAISVNQITKHNSRP